MKLIFTSGVESQLFGRDNQVECTTNLRLIDRHVTIRQISIKIGYEAIQGIRFIDDKGEAVIDENFSSFGVWVPPKKIPEGQEIIGMQCFLSTNPSINYSYIKWLGFLLWKPNPHATQ